MAIEMVRLFQVQLEHYEKVEGSTLSLEGKANQLAQMVRQHLPLAMQGLAVVPLFAGYDTARGTGRIFNYDVTGGHYEDTDFQATGSGGRDARSTIKLGWREGLPRGRGGRPGRPVALRRGRRGLGHRRARPGARHLPDRRRRRRRRVPRGARGRGGRALRRAHRPQAGGARPMSMPYYVAPEQVMKDRAEYAQKGIARGRSLVATTYDVGIAIVAENPRARCTRSARSTTASPSAGSASTTSTTSCAWPASATPTPRASPSAARTSTPARWPTSTPSTSATSSPTR